MAGGRSRSRRGGGHQGDADAADLRFLTAVFAVAIAAVVAAPLTSTFNPLVFQLFHDNSTTPPGLGFFLEPRPGFTHVRTPNSHEDRDEDIMEAMGGGHVVLAIAVAMDVASLHTRTTCTVGYKNLAVLLLK